MSDRPALPKRFYREAAAGPAEPGGVPLLLDGRRANTPARCPLLLPNAGFAAAVAAEWDAQAEMIDPARMPLTRIANTAIDGVADRMEAVRDDLARYAASDLVVYRAGEPERLVRAQGDAWDPILAHAREAYGARFILSEGIVFVAQPEEALRRVREAVARTESPFGLAALHGITTLAGSVLLALALRDGRLDAGQAWGAAHVDELFQESLWGEDHEATLRRARREEEFRAHTRALSLSGEAARV